MTIQDWGAVGELVSAIAVLATLVYLAIQIKQNTSATRAQIHQSRSEQAQEFFLFCAGSREVSELMTRLNSNPENLSEFDEVQRYQIRMLCVATMQRIKNMFFQKESGFLSEELYANQEGNIFRSLPIWDALGIIQNDSFGLEIERIRREWPKRSGT